MKILMTGSSGFIGSHLTALLDYELYHLKSDLLDFEGVRKEVLDFSPDIILHLAARTEVEQSFYEQNTFSQVNYVGTVNLVEVAKEVDTLKNFLFASTMEVYGWQPISDHIKAGGMPIGFEAFDEFTEPNPNAPYAVAKYACEKYLEYAGRCYGLPYTVVRQTNCYGRKDNDFFVTERIINQMLQGNECNLGYKEPWRNFIYIDDLMDAWCQIIKHTHKCNDGKVFTLGPNAPVQIESYANIIAEKLDWEGTINWDTRPDRPGEIYYLNSTHDWITNTIGWEPKTILDHGLDLTIDHWREINGKT